MQKYYPKANPKKTSEPNELVDSAAIISLCSFLRGGKPCELSPKMTNRAPKTVRLVEFEAGMKWIATITVTKKSDFIMGIPILAASPELMCDLEIAGCNFLWQVCS